MLADTAIVGHLGVHQLAALGLAGAVLSALFGVFNFLSYATTAQVARFDGAGRRSDADEVAGQALWLSLAIGVVLLVVAAAAAVPIVSVMGGSGADRRTSRSPICASRRSASRSCSSRWPVRATCAASRTCACRW